MNDLVGKNVDVVQPEHVEIEVDRLRRVVYVHVNGLTMFRAAQYKTIVITMKPEDEW